ncbi:hypothetical protein [Salibacterium aidingense]|uniref:hypothetical protein n=1 Tax=Salibacterium aidingense TaxID=384933 RepID=UPI003BC6632B
MTPFEPVNFANRAGRRRLTVDRQGRIMLSAALRKELNISAQLSPWVTVLYDKENDMWALQKNDKLKQAPAESSTKVDKRGYISAGSILRRNRINFAEEGPIRYEYDGDVVGVGGETYLSFKRVE